MEKPYFGPRPTCVCAATSSRFVSAALSHWSFVRPPRLTTSRQLSVNRMRTFNQVTQKQALARGEASYLNNTGSHSCHCRQANTRRATCQHCISLFDRVLRTMRRSATNDVPGMDVNRSCLYKFDPFTVAANVRHWKHASTYARAIFVLSSVFLISLHIIAAFKYVVDCACGTVGYFTVVAFSQVQPDNCYCPRRGAY